MGVYGIAGKILAWYTIMRNPELAVHVGSEDSVARQQQPKPIAELKRDQHVHEQQSVPQINNNGEGVLQEREPYKSNQYSYKVPKAAYIKPALKKIYNGIDEEVKKFFGRLRSVYQSSSGVLRNVKMYRGQDNVNPRGNVIMLDVYRANQKQYKLPHPPDENLEQKLEIPYKLAA